MGVRRAPYLAADGSEIDCAYFLTDNEYVPGFLRLPTTADVGRVRFLEDVPTLAGQQDVPVLDPVPVTLMDGKGGGVDACLLGSFVSATKFSAPIHPQFPIALTVNVVLVGSADSEHRYCYASLRSPELLEFLAITKLTPERAVELRMSGAQQASAETEELTIELRVGVEVDEVRSTDQILRFYGEIRAIGEPRSLETWAETLAEQLSLFALLADRPFRPGRIFTDDDPGRVDFYACWPEGEASQRADPLFRLPEISDQFERILIGWHRLLAEAHDLADHLVDFQIYRGRLTAADQLLSMARSLELFFAYGDRFDSKHRPSDEHRALVEEALGHLPQGFREAHGDWIGGALSNSNQKRLVDQLEAILDDLGPEVCEACRVEDAPKFAAATKDARNHYTHPTGTPKETVPEGRDLIIHVNRLWFLARACLLVELGFERPEIAEALGRSARRYLLS